MRIWPDELTDPTLLWPCADQFKERQAAWEVFVQRCRGLGCGVGVSEVLDKERAWSHPSDRELSGRPLEGLP